MFYPRPDASNSSTFRQRLAVSYHLSRSCFILSPSSSCNLAHISRPRIFFSTRFQPDARTKFSFGSYGHLCSLPTALHNFYNRLFYISTRTSKEHPRTVPLPLQRTLLLSTLVTTLYAAVCHVKPASLSAFDNSRHRPASPRHSASEFDHSCSKLDQRHLRTLFGSQPIIIHLLSHYPFALRREFIDWFDFLARLDAL